MQQASAELATTQESQGAAPPPQAEAQPAVAVQQPRLEPPPVPPRVPEQASPTDADDDDSIEVEITSADSSDNLEAISAEELTEVEAVSEREPEASQPPMPPKPPPTPAAGQAAPPPPSPAATPSPSEQDKLAPPPPRSTKGAQATRPRRKRLPRTPPRRRSFTGGSEGGKRRPWWEELWNDDFLRADPVPEEHRLFQEVDFIEQSLSVQPGAVVLDLACGAGDHAVELSRRGLSVVGYDISETQLIRAKDLAEYEEQDVRFMQGDIREMAFEKMFDAVYCWNASFGYFEEEKNLAVLANIFRSLKPGGSFLLDVPNRDFVVRQQPMQTWFEGDNAVCMDDMYVDFITSRLNVKRTVMLDDGRNREWYYSLRLYSLHELGKMLHSIGFKVGQISGDVATPNAFLGSYSQRVIILAVKPNEAPSKKS
jgi:SAM-dependent methyltransferase